MYVYIKSEENLWTTGFYGPDSEWNSDDDFNSKEDAANRVAYLNGNPKAKQGKKIETVKELNITDLLRVIQETDPSKQPGQRINWTVERRDSTTIDYRTKAIFYNGHDLLDYLHNNQFA